MCSLESTFDPEGFDDPIKAIAAGVANHERTQVGSLEVTPEDVENAQRSLFSVRNPFAPVDWTRADPPEPTEVVYISGPMRGCPDLNYPAFNAAAETLRGLGYEVINPAELSDPEAATEEAIRRDFVELAKRATMIAFLPGWQGSEGARAEYATARTLRLPPMLLNETLDGVTWYPGFDEMSEAHATPIDDEAWRLVYGDRGQSYGNPTGDFGRTAGMWSELFGEELKPLDVAKAMIALKLSRLKHKPDHWDSWADIIGYALCAWRIIQNA